MAESDQPEGVAVGRGVSPLAERWLQACNDDPMWADHAEVWKMLLRQVAEELTLLRHAQESEESNSACCQSPRTKDALEAIQAACKARKWTLIAPDGRVWQNENPMLISAALLADFSGDMQPLGGDFARILNENRWSLYDDTEAT